MLNTTTPAVEDAQFGNDSLISAGWNLVTLGCDSWKLPNHTLFQVANGILLLGLLSPYVKNGVLALHAAFVFGFLLMSVWSWVILCAPDFFTWNFAFMLINIVQTLMLIYHLKPVLFDQTMERLYQRVFQPMNVSRRLFKQLIDKNYCLVSTMYEGDAYAMQGITKTDRLGILISGSMKVYSNRNLLHMIQEMEFIDSPEFESSVTGDEKFQVSVCAATTCQYIYWPRQSLEYILLKEPFLATVLNTIMGRDITNKLYALNNRAKDPSSPCDVIPMRRKLLGADQGDLRRTLAQISSHVSLNVHYNHQVIPLGGLDKACVQEEQEDDQEGVYSAGEEEVMLLSSEDKSCGQSTDIQSHGSETSDQSGIHFLATDQPQVHFSVEERV